MRTLHYTLSLLLTLLFATPGNAQRPQPSDLSVIAQGAVAFEQDPHNWSAHQRTDRDLCTDTINTVPQASLYFCFGGCGIDVPSYEIAGAHDAAATPDSTINWIMSEDPDGAGPLTAWPDSLVPGHDVHNTSNRAGLFPGFVPQYFSTFPQVTPYALRYVVTTNWQDSGRAMAFTPIAWDSTGAGMVFELDGCFGVGQPFLKTYVRAIHADHYYTCEEGVSKLHLVVYGGLPGFHHYNGYGGASTYSVDLNGDMFTAHYGDTLTVVAAAENIITISDSLSTVPGLAEGCVIYHDTLVPYPPLDVAGLASTYFNDDPDVTLSVSPTPSGALLVNFFTSEAAAAGLWVLSATGDTLFTRYPLGSDFGPDADVDVLRSIYLYDLPLDGQPYSIIAEGDDGLGWQYATCFGLNNDGWFQVFDPATGDSLSAKLYPVGDGQCGALGTAYTDTFPDFHVQQYNHTQLSINGDPGSLSAVDSLGNATFSPSTAGVGDYQITFTYNDVTSDLCDKDTVINVSVQMHEGIVNTVVTGTVIITNPVRNELLIRCGATTTGTVMMVDALGRTILDKRFTSGQPMDVSGLAGGVYLVRVSDERDVPLASRNVVKE